MTPETAAMHQMIEQASRCVFCQLPALKNDCVCGECVAQRVGWALRNPVSEERAA